MNHWAVHGAKDGVKKGFNEQKGHGEMTVGERGGPELLNAREGFVIKQKGRYLIA